MLQNENVRNYLSKEHFSEPVLFLETALMGPSKETFKSLLGMFLY